MAGDGDELIVHQPFDALVHALVDLCDITNSEVLAGWSERVDAPSTSVKGALASSVRAMRNMMVDKERSCTGRVSEGPAARVTRRTHAAGLTMSRERGQLLIVAESDLDLDAPFGVVLVFQQLDVTETAHACDIEVSGRDETAPRSTAYA